MNKNKGNWNEMKCFIWTVDSENFMKRIESGTLKGTKRSWKHFAIFQSLFLRFSEKIMWNLK